MTNGEMVAPCPQCGSTAAVHSVSELADFARNRMGQAQPGNPGGPQQGYPQQGQPQEGWMAEPQAGAPPGPGSGPVPGYAASPQAGPPPGRRPGRGFDFDFAGDAADGIEQVVANVALGAAARFIGRKVGKRMQQAYTDRIVPAMAARGQDMMREQVAIAERYPELRACLTDKVIFLAGGSRVVPMTEMRGGFTLAQADAIVAQLRQG
jgi:hypothetical protein